MKELTKIEKAPSELMQSAMTADAVVGQVALVKEIMTKVMVKDEDYGIIPGGNKPSLWKPGSEKLCLAFRLSPSFVSVETYDGDHLTVKSTCTLTHISSGLVMGSGEAICSTKEKKYAKRKDKNTGKIVPNADLTDLWNTMIKMGNKRSLIAAVLIVTAASSMFTQDMGEDAEKEPKDDEPKQTPPKEEIKEAKATVKPSKETPLVVPVKEPGIWRGKVDHIKNEVLPDNRPCWTVVGADGEEFKTADPAFQKTADSFEGGENVCEVAYTVSKKTSTLILTTMKEIQA